MTQHKASRTLVKSPPELWAECSDASSLGRHLDQFGEIRITRLEPETAVAWEGELASGTVRLEPTGWGTKVILTAQGEHEETAVARAEPVIAPERVVAPEPVVRRERVVAPQARRVPVARATSESVASTGPPRRASTAPPRRPAPPAPRPAGLLVRFRRWLSGPQPPIELVPVQAPKPDPIEPPKPEPIELPPAEVKPEPEPLVVANEPQPEPQPQPEPEAAAPMADHHQTAHDEPAPMDPAAALTAALDSLGQAHHRPFSRA